MERKEGTEEAGSLEMSTSFKDNENKEEAEKLIDFLTDYICSHVTESLKAVVEAIEKRIIIRALQETRGNQKEAAKILGIKHSTLNYKVKRHRIRLKKNLLVSVE